MRRSCCSSRPFLWYPGGKHLLTTHPFRTSISIVPCFLPSALPLLIRQLAISSTPRTSPYWISASHLVLGFAVHSAAVCICSRLYAVKFWPRKRHQGWPWWRFLHWLHPECLKRPKSIGELPALFLYSGTAMLLRNTGLVNSVRMNDNTLANPRVIKPAALNPSGMKAPKMGPPKSAPTLKIR